MTLLLPSLLYLKINYTFLETFLIKIFLFFQSNDDFLTAYVAAFEKMIARGYAETDLTAIA